MAKLLMLPIRGLFWLMKAAVHHFMLLVAISIMTGAQIVNATLRHDVSRFIYVLQFSMYVLSVLTYNLVNFTHPGTPKSVLGYREHLMPKNVRRCQKCQYVKYSRTHHCSQCRSCILRMDHHCIWFQHCIGFRNQKFFFLLLVYLSMYAMFTAYMCIKSLHLYLSGLDENTRLSWLPVLWIGQLIFSFSMFVILSVFSVYHASLILRNITTLETLSASWSRYSSTTQPFNVGWLANWKQIMGPSVFLWFLPYLNSMGDGTEFPLNMERLENGDRMYEWADEPNSSSMRQQYTDPLRLQEQWSSDEEQYAMRNRQWNPHTGQYEWIDDLLV
ncbi:palmitoyltransferase [Schizosaccharomyces japonicus yFS275]|uniref:Palmitoyltransferase n=1 Tax=Schizosaccharomyces japonicus (strain yFS275 / FY16936) TaxID=402676 RepID=B6K0A6_SCHJY|nr:palmitoyltransferase [Schizosaccharomyces japonicus yFS275]EEB06256.1 palmitoyltransferase [Schizosaccharomyces japonicus yFS275]